MENDAALNGILESGEAVLWSEAPDPWRYTRPTFMLYIIAVPWTIFTYFWLDAVTGGFQMPKATIAPYPSWMPWVAVSFGVLLLIAGLWMLSAPFWIWRRGKATVHVLTNRRALVVERDRPSRLQALVLEGKVDFRVTDPEDAVSDVDVVCATSKGLLFRAVRQPGEMVRQVAKTIAG